MGGWSLTTNGNLRESPLQQLHRRAARELGIDADVEIPSDRFGAHNLEQVRAVFPSTEMCLCRRTRWCFRR